MEADLDAWYLFEQAFSGMSRAQVFPLRKGEHCGSTAQKMLSEQPEVFREPSTRWYVGLCLKEKLSAYPSTEKRAPAFPQQILGTQEFMGTARFLSMPMC